jgi:hypothetical protein
MAERNGVDINGKVYVSGLANYLGDPRAWVSGRDDVRRVLEERGWSSQGAVNVKGREADVDPSDVPIDPTLIEAEVAQRVAAGGGEMMGCSRVEDLKEKLTTIRKGYNPIEDHD